MYIFCFSRKASALFEPKFCSDLIAHVGQRGSAYLNGTYDFCKKMTKFPFQFSIFSWVKYACWKKCKKKPRDGCKKNIFFSDTTGVLRIMWTTIVSFETYGKAKLKRTLVKHTLSSEPGISKRYQCGISAW